MLGIVPERVMHDHKREPRNNGYYMRREYNIDLLNEIFLLVNVTLFTGFLRSLHTDPEAISSNNIFAIVQSAVSDLLKNSNPLWSK